MQCKRQSGELSSRCPAITVPSRMATARPTRASPTGTSPTTAGKRLSHVDARGRARMVDVGAKSTTQREAVAAARVVMRPETLRLIVAGGLPKGDVIAVARVAGIAAAKETSRLIPLCHP